jgi:NADPH2:quinone reductase
MRAIRVHQTGGIDALSFEDTPTPKPQPDQVLVRLACAGVNFVDVYNRSGLYRAELPITLGGEGAGEVVAVGAEVDDALIGTRVASVDFTGSYAQLATVAADRAVPIPDGIDDITASASLLQGMTAHYLLHDSYPVRSGDTLLVHAAAGGMGLLLTQWATRLGAHVIGTTSTREKGELARAAGALEVLPYDDVVAQVREFTGGEGVAAVYDGVGATTFDGSLASLRRHGVLVSYGNASGKVAPLDILRLLAAGSVYVTRPTLAHYISAPDELARRAAAVFGLVAAGDLDIHIGGRYPLADAATAHDDLENRRTTGKLVLLP